MNEIKKGEKEGKIIIRILIESVDDDYYDEEKYI